MSGRLVIQVMAHTLKPTVVAVRVGVWSDGDDALRVVDNYERVLQHMEQK